MHLKKITMKNFFSHENSTINFDSLGQISMILGSIEDDFRESNGSGKSTIIEAILFSLYEKTRLTENKNATLDDVVRWNSDGKMEIVLEFEIENKLYKITRTRDKNKNKGTATFETYSNGKWTSLVESKKNETNKLIVKTIGIDYETFCASICFQQKEIDKFVSATESERKNIIKNILQLDRYDEYRDNAKAKVSLLDAEIQAQDKILESNSSFTIVELDNKKNEEKTLELALSGFALQKQAIESQLEKLRKQQISFNNILEKQTLYKKQIEDKTSNLERINLQTSNASKKLNDHREALHLKKQEFDKYKEKFDSIKNLFVVEKNDILKEGKAIDVRLKESERAHEEVSSLYYKEEGELERLTETIENVSMLCDEKCPTCFSSITESSKASSINYLLDLKKSASDRKLALGLKMEDSKSIVAGYREKLDEVKERLQEYGKWAKEKLHLEDAMNLIKSSLDDVKMSIEDQKRTIEENNKLKDFLQGEIDSAKTALSELNFDQQSFDEVTKKITIKNEELQAIVVLVTSKQVEKGRLQNQIVQIEEQIEKTKKARSQKEFFLKEKFHFTELVKMFGKEIPTLIIENACFELAKEANRILSTISQDSVAFVMQRKNKDGSLKECFEIEITRPGIASPILIDSLSNGQKFRVVFAIRIALSRLLARRRSSTPIEFLFYDECFASLDDKGIDDIIDIFRYLKSEFKHQLIITHGTDLKDRFSSSILLVKQNRNGVSSISQRQV